MYYIHIEPLYCYHESYITCSSDGISNGTSHVGRRYFSLFALDEQHVLSIRRRFWFLDLEWPGSCCTGWPQSRLPRQIHCSRLRSMSRLFVRDQQSVVIRRSHGTIRMSSIFFRSVDGSKRSQPDEENPFLQPRPIRNGWIESFNRMDHENSFVYLRNVVE